MQNNDIEALRAAITALEGQRATLGDAVVELATAPLRARLASLLRPAGLLHRQVTVLFADVVGSTTLADGLDAEDTLAVLNGAMRRMADIVEAHQGRVLRFTGDGVKAAFGMDQAREDDAERAVRAGLAICQAGREQAETALQLHGVTGFAVRVGVHTGDVALGAGIDADRTAMGVAVNVAARMEQSAPPGALRISHDTWSQVRGLFDAEAQPPLLVKGIAAPLQTYLVLAALDRGMASVERGLHGLSTPMVGRQAELDRLLLATSQARETRQLQAVTLLGDAGLGKSRLLREFRAALPGGPAGCRWLPVRAQPDGQLRPWGLLRSLLAVQCGVADTDSADEARRKVVDGLSPWCTAPGESQARLIGQLAGLDFSDSPEVRDLDPRSLSDQALAAFRGFLQGLAMRGDAQLVLLVEDLHWADDSSLDLMQHLLAHAAELPLVLVMTARPALRTRRPDWGSADTLVHLQPLAVAARDELARALLSRMDGVPPQLAELLNRQAEGNPYYMEELVRRLIDDGVIAVEATRWTLQADRLDTLRLPGTLVGLLQARLDALPEGERRAARQASVIGHVFWDDALQAQDKNAPQALPALQRAAFVRTHETSDFEGTAERQFDHHLLHQVTYDTLLRAERRLGHGAAARWLHERTKGRSAEFLAMTGEHAERAGDTALAADCFEKAGKDAQLRFANAEAVALLRRALALLGDTAPARRLDLLHQIDSIFDTIAERDSQEAVHDDIAAVLARHPDDTGHARLLFARSLLADRRNDPALSLALAEQALSVAERCASASWTAVALCQLGWLKQLERQYDTARNHVEAGLQWARKIEDEVTRAETEGRLLTISSTISMASGRADDARTTLLAVLALGERLGSRRMQLGALSNLMPCTLVLARYEETASWAERTRLLAQSMGALQQEAAAAKFMADAIALRGERRQALPWLQRSLALRRQVGDQRGIAQVLMNLADHCLELGDAEGALRWCAIARAEPWHAGTIRYFQIGTIEGHAQLALGQQGAALATVDALLDQLRDDPEGLPAKHTLHERRACQQILQALADPRAGPMLDQLYADVQARANRITDPADRDRLIQANPVFSSIVADHRQRSSH